MVYVYRWTISLYQKGHEFKRQRLPFSDGTKNLTIASSPYYNHEQRIAIARQIEAKFQSYPANAKPTKDDFIQALKTTPNTDPTNLGTFLWSAEEWDRKTFANIRLSLIIQTKLGDLDEVAELAQSKIEGALTPTLLTILEEVKNDPTHGLKIALGGSMSELEDHFKTIVSPFIDTITSEMLKDDSTLLFSTTSNRRSLSFCASTLLRTNSRRNSSSRSCRTWIAYLKSTIRALSL